MDSRLRGNDEVKVGGASLPNIPNRRLASQQFPC
jgi:hypothetical protein